MNATGLRFFLQGVGSRGDVAPLIGLGRELLARGHEVHLLANAAYGEEALAAGLRFGAITSQTELFSGKERTDLANFVFTCLGRVAAYFERHLGAGDGAVVVNADRMFASNLVAERRDLPVVRLYLSPIKIQSTAAPSWPIGRQCAGHFGYTFRKYALPAIYDAIERNPRLVADVNRRRARLGLAAVDVAAYAEPYVRAHVALFPSWFAPPAEDWPYGLECVGFPFVGSGRCPRSLEEFIDRNGPPIVFTPGTCVPHEAGAFQAFARDCCRLLGVPGVVLSRYFDPKLREAEDDLLGVDYADLGSFLSRCRLLVHHGGIGTAAQAIRAGVPQIIVPRGFDQPDNGRRLAELGVGAVVERASASGATLADVARRLLSEPECRDACARRAASLDGVDALARAADRIERAGARASTNAAGRARAGRRKTVLFVSWPEEGHVAAPVAIARALASRGDRVAFATAPSFRPRIRALGFEHIDLEGDSDWGQRHSLFGSIPHRAALEEAVDRWIHTFSAALGSYRPDRILFDSLYSAFTLLPARLGVPFGIYETDLPRELDSAVPPPQVRVRPDGTARERDRLRTAWLNQIHQTFWIREGARARDLPLDWTKRHFPDALLDALARRLGSGVSFDRFVLYAPVARAPRMVFCPKEFDFERTRTAWGSWVGGCIDEERAEPPFPWDAVPSDRPLVYCAFGTQSMRNPEAGPYLQTVVSVLARRDDLTLVVACPNRQRPELPPSSRNVVVVERAPQLALLRRASLAITHAGFNSIKECAAHGVPMIALPLSHDQPRNAALVEHLGLGVAFDRDDPLTPEKLEAAIDVVRCSSAIRARCATVKAAFRRTAGTDAALAFVDSLGGGELVPGSVRGRREGTSFAAGAELQ